MRVLVGTNNGVVKIVECFKNEPKPEILLTAMEEDFSWNVKRTQILKEDVNGDEIAITHENGFVRLYRGMEETFRFNILHLDDVANGKVVDNICFRTGGEDGIMKMISCDESGVLRLYNWKDEYTDCAMTKVETKKDVAAMRVTDDYSLVGIGGMENLVRLFDVETQKKVFQCEKQDADGYGVREKIFVRSIAYCENNNVIVTAGGHQQIHVYDRRVGGKPINVVKHGDFAFNLVHPKIDENNHQVFASNTTGKLFSWDYRNKSKSGLHRFKGCAGSIRAIAVHPSETNIIAAVGIDRRLRIFNTEGRNIVLQKYLVQILSSVEFFSDAAEKSFESDEESSEPPKKRRKYRYYGEDSTSGL